MVALANAPFLPTFDWYIGYPTGFYCPWPPLYDCMAAWIGRLAGFGGPSREFMMQLVSFIPPLGGVATLGVFYRVCRQVMSDRAALIALALASVWPMFLAYTILGRPDHHCFENFWFVTAALFVMKLFDETHRANKFFALAAGVSLAMGCLFWIGSLYFSGILFSVVLGEYVLHSRRGQRLSASLRDFPLVFFVQIPILALIGGNNHWYSSRTVDFDSLSIFQPLVMAVFGFWLSLLAEWFSHKRWWLLGIWALAACGASSALILWGLRSVIHFAFLLPPIFKTVEELQPLLGHWPNLNFQRAMEFYGWTFWLAPLLALAFGTTQSNPRKRLVIFWFMLSLILSLRQLRYGLHVSLPFALLLGYGADLALTRIHERTEKNQRRFAAVMFIVFSIGLLSPIQETVRTILGLKGFPPKRADLVETCEWIRDHTPKTRSLWVDEGRPEYGVFSLHDIGLQIASIAERPAVAGNYHTMNRSIMESLDFFFETDSEKAYRFLAQRNFRYLVLADIIQDDTLSSYARLYGKPGYDPVHGLGNTIHFSPRMWDLVYTRLYVADGSRGFTENRIIEAADHFRLVYESRTSANGVALYKVFEVVPGLGLKGRCQPATAIEASNVQRSSQNRPWTYHAYARCSPRGTFEMRLPYVGQWMITNQRRTLRTDVSEEDILTGQTRDIF
jgi:asparagine N-glycosylation enzyme membrane subunit Stt3